MQQVTVQEAFDQALQLHQAGRLRDAESVYQQIIAVVPEHVDSIHNLGVIALQLGRSDLAAVVLRRAVALRPGFADGHSNLGNALLESGKRDEAISAYRIATALRPNFTAALNNLGVALQDKGELAEAISIYRQILKTTPDSVGAHFNLGKALNEDGQKDEAIASYRHAIFLKPDYAEARNNLGVLLIELDQADAAIAEYCHACAIQPGAAILHHNLGFALMSKGQVDDAIAEYRHAIQLKPDYADAYCSLGLALNKKRNSDEAIIACQQAIAIQPRFAAAYNNLGMALKEKGELDLAVEAFKKTIALDPKLPQAFSNLGVALRARGDLDEAISAYRDAIKLNPKLQLAWSNLLFALHFHPGYGAGKIAEEHRKWNGECAVPLLKPVSNLVKDLSPNRRLRIGYISPDFRDHAVGRNVMPLFLNHDRAQFQIYCYSQTINSDAMTTRFQENCDSWCNIAGVDDEQLFRQIRGDHIDVLVDLALHTADNRLLLFARKPAPIQATFAGYPGSTGLTAIDYRQSDPFLDPPGMDESIYSEQTIRLPDSFWCYDPLDCSEVPINLLPAARTGFVTFGCLNNFFKINQPMLLLWARVMRGLEKSRLILLAAAGTHRQRTLDLFAEEGIESDRIEFVSQQSRKEYLEVYHRIDLGLDSFPYNGHTTSLDSYWMGVPVVTLTGQTAVSRAGWCQLSNLDLTELAGSTPDEFVQIAIELARDLPRLQELRSTLRLRMEKSPLMDGRRFARNIEAVYRKMWAKRCDNSTQI